jgi:6-phosphofructokinase 1
LKVSIELEGENGILPFLKERVALQGHAVVVVAEGAGEELLGKSNVLDAGGNRKLPPIGVGTDMARALYQLTVNRRFLQDFLKDAITDYFKKEKSVATVKYIDPSYMIRSVPANSSDALMCMLLAQNAVHGGMYRQR